MPSFRFALPAAGLLALTTAVPVRTAAQRVGETAVAPVSNLGPGARAVTAAPAATLTAAPLLLAAPGAIMAPAALAPAPLPQAALPAAAAAPAAAPAADSPVAPLDALKNTGLKLDAAARPGAEAQAPAALDALYEGRGGRDGGASAVDGRVAAPAARLDALAPKNEGAERRMPAGVRIAFQKSAVMGGGMAALFAGLYAMTHGMAPNATLPQFALAALPLALLPLHFALVSGFWAGRYYLYPKLGAAGKTAFRGAWTVASAVYPAAALLAIGAWTALLASQPSLLLLFSPVAVLAAAEVVHHFVYRVASERRQDDGKSLLDWKSRAWGNVGQQLRRMRRRGA